MKFKPSVDIAFAVIVFALFGLLLWAGSAMASTPTSDLVGDYDGPVVDTPLVTVVSSEVMTVGNVKLPDASSVGLFPWVCYRKPHDQKIVCLVVDAKSQTAYWKILYLKKLET